MGIIKFIARRVWHWVVHRVIGDHNFGSVELDSRPDVDAVCDTCPAVRYSDGEIRFSKEET